MTDSFDTEGKRECRKSYRVQCLCQGYIEGIKQATKIAVEREKNQLNF